MTDLKQIILVQFSHMNFLHIDATKADADAPQYQALQELVASGHVKRVDLDHLEFYRPTALGLASVGS